MSAFVNSILSVHFAFPLHSLYQYFLLSFSLLFLSPSLLGDGLTYCPTRNLQCCTNAYFNSLRSTLTADLSTGVVLDLQPVLNLWRDTFDLSEGINRCGDSSASFSGIQTLIRANYIANPTQPFLS